jgi:hypothetical protein
VVLRAQDLLGPRFLGQRFRAAPEVGEGLAAFDVAPEPARAELLRFLELLRRLLEASSFMYVIPSWCVGRTDKGSSSLARRATSRLFSGWSRASRTFVYSS